MKTIISKGEFARAKQRSPACVTKWIRAGKISGDALIGHGNAAKIWVERAESDLAASLDPSQQLSQAAPILPPRNGSASVQFPAATQPAGPFPLSPPPIAPPSQRPSTIDEDRAADLARRAKADADKAEHDAEAARRKLAVDEGRYILAEEASRAWGREMARFIADAETFLTSTLARDLALAHNLDWKVLAVEMRTAWHKFRSGVSDEARVRRETIEAEAAE